MWAALALAIVVAGDFFLSRERPSQAEGTWQVPRPVLGPATYTDAIAALDEEVERKRAMVAAFPGDWVRHEGLALAHLDRFRLSGDYADLAQARETVRRGMQLAEAPGGPVLAYAEIGLASHRLDEVAASLRLLDRWVAPDRSERAAAAALAGDVAFYRGDMGRARDRYAAAQATGAPGALLRMAVLEMARGDVDAAIAAMRTSFEKQRRPSPYAIATTALRIGAAELARGDIAEARRLFEEADRVFPGYWLTQAHIAQASAMEGELGKGIVIMRRVAERSGSAEAMDALAMLLRSAGQPGEAREWARRASSEWSRRIDLAPEAALGHAVEHELVFGTPARALALARRNLANRPYGESRLLLANALVQNGLNGAALDQLDRAEKSGWRSAPLHALRAEILALEGDRQGAADARAAARAINPAIFEPETALVWFSHG